MQNNLTKAIKNQDPTSFIPMEYTGVAKINYNNFEKRINELAKGFLIRGIQQNSTVLILKESHLQFIESILALSKIEATIKIVCNADDLLLILKKQPIDAVLLPIKIILQLFKKEVLQKQNREFLCIENLASLNAIFSYEPIKLRGTYTLNELILLGKHVDDMEIEEHELQPSANTYFIAKISIENDQIIESGKYSQADISTEQFPFFDLKKLF